MKFINLQEKCPEIVRDGAESEGKVRVENPSLTF
jgi:hypothetical protein